MTLQEMIERQRAQVAARLAERAAQVAIIATVRDAVSADNERDLTPAEDAEVRAAVTARDAVDAQISVLRSRLDELEAEQRADEAAAELSRMVTPTGVQRQGGAFVTRGDRTYRPDTDARGAGFIRDAVLAHLGDFNASSRLSRHMDEERAERAAWFEQRAVVGTGAFAGLVVPQYLTDMVAPAAKAGRPFANAIRRLPIPDAGMTVNISRITTATTTAVQTQGSAVSETDIDDTLLSPAVQTIAGSQSVTRQAIERGTGTLDVVLEDLARSYNTVLDSTLLNQATNGLTNVATSIAYTDASPTAAELYPKLLQGVAAVEAALLDQVPGDTIAVMHSRRWYWIQSQLSSTFPLVSQGFALNVGGEADPSSRYGSGYRGTLPGGTPVIVDNNIGTTLGAGTEDEIYFVSQNEAFLWEDPAAPMLLRTETGPSIKSLGVDVVLYGYVAYTFARQPHAQKIAGTGLIAPTF
jgi:HK97 family phage major capsid protein